MKTIFQAAHENDLDALREVLASARAVDPETGWTALHFAASQNSAAAAGLLLEAGAAPDALTPAGETPLHLVAGAEVARVLLAVADVSTRDGAARRTWREGSFTLFQELAVRSEVYLRLREAWLGRLLVRGVYHEEAREFRVMKLGWKDARERCLAWQYGKGWRCFEVADLSEVSLSGEAPELDRAGKPPVCVELLDEGAPASV
ncbi:MAG: ankyrin repeat domain-containing protein [Candidatus Eremiobacteraeota bacterium]|nr:ankyrin repeat domain-containing protein [Candidatus Eremiobacteraeota bacterium]MCW5869612.1 ankyrin repeat domain-containing protein [Candidatus Eremiobacteraeota bacterium]